MLEQKLKSLAGLQKALDENEACEQVKLENLKALPEFQALEKIREEKSRIKDLINKQREKINELTLKTYLETGEKKPASGVGIRIYTNYIYDEDKAFEYCRGSLPAALKLDKRKFEKYVKGVHDVQPLDFVEMKEDPRPTIVSDLSEYLD